MAVRGIRGAITVEHNDATEIISETKLLLKEIMDLNSLNQEDIASIIFTVTKDLDAAFPAVAARHLGVVDVALICMKEIDVPGSLEKCIRILIHANTEKTANQMKHLYMKGAKVLRPDISIDKKIIQIAIDGPAGAGKSTIAKSIAKELDILYLDTGAMYRAAALKAIREGVSPIDVKTVEEFAKDLDMEVIYENGSQQIYLGTENVNGLIRTPEISKAASDISAVPAIRLKLVDIQRRIAENGSVIMDGRDIGTYVLPNAKVKVYLTASPEERARRRHVEEKQKGNIDISYEEILKDMIIRDKNDSSRAFAPLSKAPDAFEIDSTSMSPEEVKEFIINICNKKQMAEL